MFSCNTGSHISDIHEKLSQCRIFPPVVSDRIRATSLTGDSSERHTISQQCHTILNTSQALF